ncbi:hypothetical protein ETD86_37705 [Nonomuraea turkmeniaca]|uniref:Uncharacterized protein n=1 Tax=Nonomuraea turkmeniaca TaxID=103838 RepID=A0A5S4F438_9ACTN|nr:hypothetical protein [Nonomuraea turkmeniaca]TMR10904.1 hypothetical protein ETD86_37705 [Nonomuraea turkmeniaca]
MNEEAPDIVGAWLHAYEEDTDTTAVYHPEDYPFRPSRRPRRGMDFHADGTFVEWVPGPDDRPREVAGRWARQETDRIRVTFPEGQGEPFDLTVVSREGDTLSFARGERQ